MAHRRTGRPAVGRQARHRLRLRQPRPAASPDRRRRANQPVRSGRGGRAGPAGTSPPRRPAHRHRRRRPVDHAHRDQRRRVALPGPRRGRPGGVELVRGRRRAALDRTVARAGALGCAEGRRRAGPGRHRSAREDGDAGRSHPGGDRRRGVVAAAAGRPPRRVGDPSRPGTAGDAGRRAPRQRRQAIRRRPRPASPPGSGPSWPGSVPTRRACGRSTPRSCCWPTTSWPARRWPPGSPRPPARIPTTSCWPGWAR